MRQKPWYFEQGPTDARPGVWNGVGKLKRSRIGGEGEIGQKRTKAGRSEVLTHVECKSCDISLEDRISQRKILQCFQEFSISTTSVIYLSFIRAEWKSKKYAFQKGWWWFDLKRPLIFEWSVPHIKPTL